MPKIVVVRGEDWAALYVDGELVDQNHDVEHQAALAAGVKFVNFRNCAEDKDMYNDGSGWPGRLEDYPAGDLDLRDRE